MAVMAMAGLTFNSIAIATPHHYPKNYSATRNGLFPLSISAQAFSNSTSSAGRIKDVATRAVARTAAVEEGVADAKRAIDEALMMRNRGGGGGALAESSWALYADDATKKVLSDAVTKLSACRGQDLGEFLRSADAHGVWEVFYAPHIFALSSAVGTQIRPLQYILRDSGFSSHVRYLSPVGEGWLSAAGDYVVRDGKTVEILFDSFWADARRDNLQPDPKGEGMIQRTLVNLAGRGAFVSALSVYPVYYADADVTVFEFTTLRTRIAARKIRTV